MPAIGDGLRGAIAKLTGSAGAQPQNIGEVIQLMNAEVERLKVLAQLDSGGETYRWVEAIRKLQRPLIAMVVLIAWALAAIGGYGGQVALDITTQLAQIVFSYLFGERAYLATKKK
jgi:hypothetical protein